MFQPKDGAGIDGLFAPGDGWVGCFFASNICVTLAGHMLLRSRVSTFEYFQFEPFGAQLPPNSGFNSWEKRHRLTHEMSVRQSAPLHISE